MEMIRKEGISEHALIESENFVPNAGLASSASAYLCISRCV